MKNNGRVAFIGIVIHNHFVLAMSLFIDFDVSLPKTGSFFRTIFGSAALAVTKKCYSINSMSFYLFVTAKAALPKIVLKKLPGLGSETSKSINKLRGSTKWL